MDQSSSAGPAEPASPFAFVKSVVTTNLQPKSVASSEPWVSIAISDPNYQVADLFGRCFLRVCYWVDVFSSFTRRGQPVQYTQPSRRSVGSLQTPAAAAEIPELVTEQGDSVLAASPKALEA